MYKIKNSEIIRYLNSNLNNNSGKCDYSQTVVFSIFN